MRWLASLAFVAACGSAPDPECRTSYLNYSNFGQPFIESWCRGCHGENVLAGMRQGAPYDVNFDTIGEVRDRASRILEMAGTGSAMPPAGGPSDAERQMLVEWISCGMPQ
jgi:uncharacterized membrane protein